MNSSDSKAREAFESTMSSVRPHWAWSFTPDPVFGYHNQVTRSAWEGWQAALQWAASQQAAEGCTPKDAEVLRQANLGFAEENQRLRQALRFYAAREHFNLSDKDEWDTVSGEPQNWWCDSAGTATIEDGSIAAMALRGEAIEWSDEDGNEEPPVCPGEPESLIVAPPSTQGGADEQR